MCSSARRQSTPQKLDHRLIILLSRPANDSLVKEIGLRSRSFRLAQQQALSQLVDNTSRCQHRARNNQPLVLNVGQGMRATCSWFTKLNIGKTCSQTPEYLEFLDATPCK